MSLGRSVVVAGICAGCTLLLARAPAQAQLPRAALEEKGEGLVKEPPAPRLVWNPDWPRFRPVGYAVMGASVIGALTVTAIITYPDGPRWSGGILFDDDVRDGLRARDPATRDGIRTASDITLALGIVNAVIVDSIVVPLAGNSGEVAFQLLLMDATAFSLNTLIATLMFKAVARARPPTAQCALDSNFDPLCDTGSYASFPSSHTSTAFTAAGLSCAHHAYLPLYGGGVWDATACAGSLALATATGLFRIIGDRHYATDVLMGAGIGLGLGYLYPWLFHYGAHLAPDPDSSSSTTVRWGLVPTASGAPYGLSLLGQF